MKHMSLIAGSVLAGAVAALPIPVLAQDAVKVLSKQAILECHRGRAVEERAARLAHFQKGQMLAEQAVALDDRHADAHFSLFCNLGEQLRLDGESITSMFGFQRMMKELDRTIELNPGHLDALSAKGTLLVELPEVLGGDRGKGEQLLQHVIQRAPKAINARLALAKVQCERGRHQEAMILAYDALAIAQNHRKTEFLREATAVLQQLQTNATKMSYKQPL